MPPMVFQATCPSCGEVRKFIEFKAEPCSDMSPFERRYGFRCLKCKTILPELVDAHGTKHSWTGTGQHLAA